MPSSTRHSLVSSRPKCIISSRHTIHRDKSLTTIMMLCQSRLLTAASLSELQDIVIVSVSPDICRVLVVCAPCHHYFASSSRRVLITRMAASLWTPNICPHGQWYSLHAGHPPCGLPIYVITDNGTHYPHDSLLVDSQYMSSLAMVLTTHRAAPSWIARQAHSTTWRRSCGRRVRHGTVLYIHCHQLYTYLFYQCTLWA